MIDETMNYRYDNQIQDDNNVGVIQIYRKNDNAWIGFIRYIKKDENNKPFVKYFASDIGSSLDQQFKYELTYYLKELGRLWKESDDIDLVFKQDLEVKFHMEIDKGDGKPPKKVVV
jgi:hypothetical protein